MALRFQKRIKVIPGVHLNLSKSGMSASVGGHGATANVGMSGRKMITLGIPGTGLSYRMPMSGSVLLLLLGIAAVVGVAYLLAPDLVMQGLHWWQPKWFPLG